MESLPAVACRLRLTGRERLCGRVAPGTEEFFTSGVTVCRAGETHATWHAPASKVFTHMRNDEASSTDAQVPFRLCPDAVSRRHGRRPSPLVDHAARRSRVRDCVSCLDPG